jgi:hypothetical protein
LLASTGGITAGVVLPTESSVGTNDNNVVFIKIKELYTDIDDIYQLTSKFFTTRYTGNLIVNVASTPKISPFCMEGNPTQPVMPLNYCPA